MSELTLPDCDFSIEARGDCLYVKAEGLDSAEVSLDIGLTISQKIAQTDLRKVLFEDYLDMQKAKHTDVMRFIQRIVLIRIPFDCKIAVVCKPEKYGTNQFIANSVSRFTPYKARVFTRVQDAQDWLDSL